MLAAQVRGTIGIGLMGAALSDVLALLSLAVAVSESLALALSTYKRPSNRVSGNSVNSDLS